MPNRRDYDTKLPGAVQSWNYVTNKVNTTTSTEVKRAFRTSTDSKRHKPQARWVAPTNYSMTEWSQAHLSGFFSTIRKSDNFVLNWMSGERIDETVQTAMNTDGPTLGLGVSPEAFPGDLANQALIKARTKLKSQDLNLAVAYGERSQTARLIGDSLKRVAGMYRDLKRGRFRNLERTLSKMGKGLPDKIVKDVPSMWLELQYGWKPLLSDIHGACEALDARDRDDWIVTVKGSAVRKGTYRCTRDPALANAVTLGQKCELELLFGSFCRIDARPSSTSLQSAASLGLLNPLSVAWELLPFSFVVDWAYPLGDYINQMDALAGWEVRGTSTSNLTRAKWSWEGVSGAAKNDPSSRCIRNTRARRRFVRLDRTAGTSVPFPMLPSIKDPFSKTHVANALSLLAGAFGRSSHVR